MQLLPEISVFTLDISSLGNDTGTGNPLSQDLNTQISQPAKVK